jgi:hypothetical protein
VVDLNLETKLVPDQRTGLLESPRTDRVPVESKAKLIEIYRQTGNLTQACRVVGLDPRNMRLHYNQDEVFKAQLDEARQEICDRAEGYVVEYMARPSNVVDRMAWLRAYRPGIWNPERRIEVQHNIQVTQQLAQEARKIVETEAIASPSLADSTLEVEGNEVGGTSTSKEENGT